MTIRTLALATAGFLAFVLVALPMRAQQPASTGAISGRVVDRQTGEAIAKASVSLAMSPRNTTTAKDGRFTLNDLPPGPAEVRVFTVGYGLLKTRVEITLGSTVELELRLGPDTMRDEQQITVVAGPFDAVVPDTATQYSLNNAELQDLSTVLANDPLRAVSSLPGVSSNSDYYADFATRGAGPSHTGVYLDGVLIDHPAYSFEDSADLGSLSVVNGEVIRSVTLMSGSFPATYGDRTGAILDIASRDGARDRIVTRFVADVLGAALTSEGPIGRNRKASWLASGRQSYLGYLLDRLGLSKNLTLNYDDIAGKLSYEPNQYHKFNMYSTYGATTASRTADNTAAQAATFFTAGGAQHGMSVLHWDWVAAPATLLQSQTYWTRDHEHDTNPSGAVDLDTTSQVYGFRSDLTHQLGKASKFQAGLESRSPSQQRNSYQQWDYFTNTLSNNLVAFDHYSQSLWQPGAYLQATTPRLKQRLTLAAGGRWAYSLVTSQNVWLPHASAILQATRSTVVSAAFGQYAQMPSLLQRYGAFGNPALRAELATHESVTVDQYLSEKTRIRLDLYNRSERDNIYSPSTEFRLLPNNQVAFPVLGPVLANTLDDYARGFELSLQRRSANGLSGWIAYARNYSRYWQPNTSFNFDGDYDQRNTFSTYGAYRITKTIDVSANTRYGSGFPIPGYITAPQLTSQQSGASVFYQLSTARNTQRQEVFLRIDARINKVFTTKHFNLTVHGEIENITGHKNYTYYNFRYPKDVASSNYVYARRQSSLLFLPVAGFTLEF
jgi:hypothetical protein